VARIGIFGASLGGETALLVGGAELVVEAELLALALGVAVEALLEVADRVGEGALFDEAEPDHRVRHALA